MCIDGVGHLVMNDENIQRLMSHPSLGIIHKQVVMSLYSLDANHELPEYKRMLPIYLGIDWEACQAIIDAIEKAGLVARTSDGIVLTHPVQLDASPACGCR
ncbi:MAG: hypothetical protein HY912_11675 [Desulfomonile tiedjei]|uniref:Uncharacterized protein n=1 Tax=Desulfomonile tiedjei TaxID=2358 RepID=A0A9D6V3M9_9BACT|nr:hypothetical protein [Desulfomonile tiedjei]